MSRISQSQRKRAAELEVLLRPLLCPTDGDLSTGMTKEKRDKISLPDSRARGRSPLKAAALSLPAWWETDLGDTPEERLATIRRNLQKVAAVTRRPR
jgi:hypothetical protein